MANTLPFSKDFLDSGRSLLKEKLEANLAREGAKIDPIQKTIKLIDGILKSTSADRADSLSNLRGRLSYPQEISSKEISILVEDLKSLSKTIDELAPPLINLAIFYEDAASQDLPQSTVRIRGDLIEPHLITQKLALKLLSRNRYGDILKSNESGNHPVISFGGVHLKSATENDPLDTGMETAVYLLHTLLLGEENAGIAPSSLLCLENVEIKELEESVQLNETEQDHLEEAVWNNQRSLFYRHHPQLTAAAKPRSFALQASMSVEGERLDELLDRKEKLSFDPENFSALILASFLTIPSDNKPDNFMVAYDHSKGKVVARLVGIDNDMVFAYPLNVIPAGGGKKEHVVSLKNALYFFDQMMRKPVDPNVRKRIGNLNPLLLGIEWAAAVAKQNQRYERLSIEKKDQASLPLRFTPSTLHNLIENLQTLQKILSDPSTKFVTHQELFRHLFPVIERFYRGLGEDMGSTKEKVENLFSIGLPPLEKYLNLREPLEDGRTVAEALDSENKTARAQKEERKSSIEDLSLTILASTDLSLLPPQDQAALLELVASHFPQIADRNDLHPSWQSNGLAHLLVKEGCTKKTLLFLHSLGIDIASLNEQHETILFAMVRDDKRYCDHLTDELLKLLPLETQNSNGLTALDVAMAEKSIPSFNRLIRAGAGTHASSTAALSFYNETVKDSTDPELQQSFQKLAQINSLVNWKMAWETILPKQCQEGTPVKSALNGNRALTQEAAKQLWTQSGAINKVNTSGRRSVGRITIGQFTLYFKQAPELPGLEQAVGTLTQQIMGFGTPHTDLVSINGVPYLVSQGIEGLNLQEVIEKNPEQIAQLDKTALSQLLLMTMLINPEDGKPDNYIVQPKPNQKGYQIVSIDNDHAFVPSVAKETFFQSKKNRVQVKTILYCLEQMNTPIDPKVRDQFLNHDPAEILSSWLGHLTAVHSIYHSLFTDKERKQLFNTHGTYVGVPFRPEMVTALYRKMVQMQFLLSRHQDNPNYSHLEMLLEIDPPLGSRYQRGFQNSSLKTAFDRFRFIDGGDYDMKAGSLVSTREAKEILQSQNIATKAEMANLLEGSEQLNPLEALDKLREVVAADQSSLANQLMQAEGVNVDFASLTDEQATNILKKIDFSKLPAPIVQSILSQLTTTPFRDLPLSHASTLTSNTLLRFNFTLLTALDLSYCQQLTEDIAQQVLERAPFIRKLNLSGISSFLQIQGAFSLRTFEVTSLDLKNITHLYLNHCKNLHTLMLSGDYLAVVECESTALKKLEIHSKTLSNFNLKNNESLTDTNLDVTVTSCPNLRRLNLEGCTQITGKEFREKFPFYPYSLFTTVEDEQLKKAVLSLLENDITSLDLNRRKIGDSGAKALAEALTHNSSLQTLNLRGNEIGDSGSVALAEALKSNSSLQTLKLGYNQIGASGAAALAEALKSNSSLQTLKLRNNQIGASGSAALAEALKSNSSLQTLRLESNKIGTSGAAVLAEALKSNRSLKELDLNYNDIGDKGAVVLAEALKSNSSLQAINLTDNLILDEGSAALAEALKSNSSLQTLNLNINLVGAKGAAALAEVLKSNSSLQNLNLESNKIGASGAAALAEALKSNSSLKELDLNSNNIGTSGSADLAEALKSNSSLQKLDLHYNDIGDKGAAVLAEALKSNSSLQTLKLGYNHIGNSGSAALAEALKSNRSLKELDLNSNNIGAKEAVVLAEALKNNSSLQNLKLENSSIGSEGAAALAEALKSNTSLQSLNLENAPWNPYSISSEGAAALTAIGFTDNERTFTRGMKSEESSIAKKAAKSETPPEAEGDHLLEPTEPIINVHGDDISEEESTSGRQSDPETLFLKGKVLEYRDKQEAVEVYLEAAKLGHKEALERLIALSSESHHAHFAMGSYYEFKKDMRQAVACYAQAASCGHFEARQALHRLAKINDFARANLAILMQYGLGMKRDIEKALEMHKVAADRGEALSKLHLGILYHQGFSSTADREKALGLVKEAEDLGLAQANEVWVQILKERKEIVQRESSSKPIDEALRELSAVRKGGSAEVIHQLAYFRDGSEKAALSKSEEQRKIESKKRFESRQSDLNEQIRGWEELADKNNDPTEKEQLKGRINSLKKEIESLENEFIAQVTLDPVEKARQYLLNQKRALFHNIFKQKIEEVFTVAEAVLSGKATRNVSLFEEGTASAMTSAAGYAVKMGAKETVRMIPLIGPAAVALTQFTVGRAITAAREEKIKKQCLKIRSYLPKEGSEGISELSSLLAQGLTYRLQDQLIQLHGESLEMLAEHLASSFGNYLFEKAPHGISTYELLTYASLHQFETLKERFQGRPLRTNEGVEITIDDLMLSTGLQTPYGGKFLPKDPKRRETISHLKERSPYRLGTKEEIELLTDMGIEMECMEEERVGILVTSIDSKKAAARFMREAQGLANQYLA